MRTINSPVTITAMRFGRHMSATPCRMQWDGREYQFTTSGVRINIKGERRGTVTLSDGAHTFCLSQNGSDWTLQSIV